ncbi:hypothetical protein [Methylosinus sp. LW3]|uniref:hypothetical protein n=1 Tax=Methylosinus sp. LW3 TaxID=107635 RepID=UPI0012F9078B|nr:hypothetical protein [Methylosinus sp. LW3]
MGERNELKNEGFVNKLKRYREASARAEALAQEEGALLRGIFEQANRLERASATDRTSQERAEVNASCQAAVSRLREVQTALIEATACLNMARRALEPLGA